MCGCGELTRVAPKTDNRRGHVKGEQIFFIHGHYRAFGEQNANWKGDDVSYKGIHKYISIRYPKKNKCEHCDFKGFTEYASKDHKYSRKREDYLELCVPCHQKYDTKMALLRTKTDWGYTVQ